RHLSRSPRFPYTTLFRSGRQWNELPGLVEPVDGELEIERLVGLVAQRELEAPLGAGRDRLWRENLELVRDRRIAESDVFGRMRRSEEHTSDSSHQIISYA